MYNIADNLPKANTWDYDDSSANQPGFRVSASMMGQPNVHSGLGDQVVYKEHKHLNRKTIFSSSQKGIQEINQYMGQNDMSDESPDEAFVFLRDITTVIEESRDLSGAERTDITYALVRLVDRYLIKESKDDRRLVFHKLTLTLRSEVWKRNAERMTQKGVRLDGSVLLEARSTGILTSTVAHGSCCSGDKLQERLLLSGG